MDKTERYLAALEEPGAAPRPAGVQVWPEGIPANLMPDPEHPLEYQFLGDDSIGHYLSSLRDLPPGHASQPPQAFPVDFSQLGQDWKADAYPLALCEFLAYKSGLAYRSPRHIQHDLLGLDAKGRRYKDGIDQFAFFDTSAPQSTVRYADTQAFAFVHRGTGYLIFRGTTGLSDWSTNLSGDLTSDCYAGLATVPQTLVGKPRPARHCGFAIAWGSVAPDVEAWVQDQLANARIDKIVLSGHSLGGALAFLGAYHFASSRICPVHAVVTFGAPKVGGEEFRKEYESPRLGLRDRTLRIEAKGDVVAQISRGGVDQHVGHLWRLEKRPLRPLWQMMLFSPQNETEKKPKPEAANSPRIRARPDQRKSSGRHNAPPEEVRTWQAFFLQLLFMALWYVAKSFVKVIAAHSVETRYGLYISTLSYRRIRKYHNDQAHLKLLLGRGQENERIIQEGAFVAANNDLSRHLGVVRGRHPRTFRYLAKRPIRIASPEKLIEYERKFKNYIA